MHFPMVPKVEDTYERANQPQATKLSPLGRLSEGAAASKHAPPNPDKDTTCPQA